MSGTDKWKVMVIGKGAGCFKGICMDRLPVLYYGNNNAWMTSETIKKWLIIWYVELQWKSWKMFLIIDSCAADPL
jgi:hypothetical protein